MDIDTIRLLYRFYAWKEEKYGAFLNSIDDFEIPLLSMIDFIYGEEENETFDFSADFSQDIQDMHKTVSDAREQLEGDEYSRMLVMTTGPIERYPHFRPQIHKSRRFSYTRCAGGAFRMLWGYTKKMVLADNMNLYIKMVYDTPAEMNGPNLVAATLLFSLRLYLDFSGCCDIAIGAARILGYDLLENFHSPFEATSFAGLWQRWHMSLTGWLRDYIYIPLGGSRCNVVRHMLNTLIVFAVSGLWHGADLRYLEWGIACGVISVIAQLSKVPRKMLWRYNPLYREPAVQTFLQRCITYLLFSFTMVFFASAIYNAAPGEVFAGILQGWQGGFAAGWESVTNLATSSGIDGRLPVVLTCGTAIVLAMEHNGNNVARWIRKQCFVLRWTVYYAAAVSILFFAAFGQSAFIYQQF